MGLARADRLADAVDVLPGDAPAGHDGDAAGGGAGEALQVWQAQVDGAREVAAVGQHAREARVGEPREGGGLPAGRDLVKGHVEGHVEPGRGVREARGRLLVEAAELIRDYPGWAEADKAKFRKVLNDVFYQAIKNGDSARWGNQGLSGFKGLLAMAIFLFYYNYTVTGRKGKILANNQAAGVNIGIWEEANVSQTAMFTGAIVGLAATIYVSQNAVAPQASLSTAGIMFSYIVPVYMGMFIGLASNDVIGISIAAIGMGIFNYGLNCMNLGGGGWQQIIMGLFVMGFYTFSAQLDNLKKLVRRLLKKDKEAVA